MYSKPHIEVESVRNALEAMRQAKTLGLVHPLARFLSISGEARQFHTAAEADNAIFYSLARLIRRHLNDHRSIVQLPPLTSDHGPVTLADDYRAGNSELEAWSLLYYRYVRVDLDLPVEDLEALTGQPKRTLNRRQAKGVSRLTQALIRREEKTRARYHQAALKAQLPLLYAPKLFGRDALIETAIKTLARPSYPRHLVLYGPSGIGKTSVALTLAHMLIENLPLDNVIWIEQPETTSEQLIRQINVGLSVPLSYELSLANHLQLTDTLLVLDQAQALIDSHETLETVLKTLGTARLLLCADHPPGYFIDMAQLHIPELDKELALTFLAHEAAKINPTQAENVEHFATLYRQLGGNPRALQLALAMGKRYQPRLVSAEMYHAAWEESPELSRLLWLVIALGYARKRSQDDIMGFMRGVDADEVHLAFANLTDAAILEADSDESTDMTLSALARSFALNVLREPANYALVQSAVHCVADRLAEQPTIADCLHLLKIVQNAVLPAELLIDLAYSFGPILERAGEWLMWAHYLEPLHAAASGEDRLWIGLRLGVARRWLTQWKASAYTLSNLIEEAGRIGAFTLQADAIVELAVIQRHQGAQEAVQKLLSQANKHYTHSRNAAGIERVAAERGWAALERNEAIEAQTYLDRMTEQQSGRWLHLAAHVAFRMDLPHEALIYAQQAQAAYQGDHSQFTRVCALLGQIHYQLGNHNVAIDHLSGALDMMQQSHDLLGHARTRMNLAAVYLGLGNLRTALDYLRDLPEDLERLGDTESLKATLQNLEVLNRVARQWKRRSA